MSDNNYTLKLNVQLIKEGIKELQETVEQATEKGINDAAKKTDQQLSKFQEKIQNNIKAMKNEFIDLSVGIVKNIFRSTIDLFKSSIKEMTDMLEFSQLSNRQTRELAFGYGFSSSEAYGYSKAMKQLGFESEEDLMYANAQELKQFREAFEKYSNYYDNLAESGYFEKIQEYQVAMEDFKMEVQQQFIQFFIDNKDVIIGGMKAIMQLSQWVMTGLSWLFRGNSSSVATTADVISQFNTTTSNTTANLNVNNTFNNVDSSVSSGIAKEVNSEYRQIIRAMGGRV